jgi:hypothetical protein
MNRWLAFSAACLAAVTACATDTVAPAGTVSSEIRDSGANNGNNGSTNNGNNNSGTVVVTESDVARQPENTPPTRSWVLYTRLAGNGAFVTGPGNPPLGIGSLALVTPTAADKVTLFNYDHVGTLLSSINAISYATYRDPASTATAGQLPSINIEVDYNGSAAGGFTTLVFEPIYNPSQGAIQSGVWQRWNAYSGIWWSTRDIPGVCANTCYVRWSDIVAANPNAVIGGGFGVNQGSGNGGLNAATDALALGTSGSSVTYNFEPFRTPATKDDCKNGGWTTLRTRSGETFKNQGQCVSYANHNNGNGSDDENDDNDDG